VFAGTKWKRGDKKPGISQNTWFNMARRGNRTGQFNGAGSLTETARIQREWATKEKEKVSKNLSGPDDEAVDSGFESIIEGGRHQRRSLILRKTRTGGLSRLA